MPIEPRRLDSVAAMMAAQRTAMRKQKGEKDTAFVKRIVCAYLNALADAERFRRAMARDREGK